MNQEDVWRKNVFLYLLSQIFSLLGSSVVDYTLIWYITIKTQSGIVMSVSLLVTFLPRVMISVISGRWIDRWNKKIILGMSDGGIAVTSLILAVVFLWKAENLSIVLIFMFFRSIGSGLQSPCEKAFVAELVPADNLVQINSWSSGVLSAMNLLSPIIGGIVLTYFSMPAALFMDVVTAAAAVTILPFVKRRTGDTDAGYGEAGNRQNLYDNDSDTINFKRKIYTVNLLFAFLITPVTYLSNLYIVKYYGTEVWRLTYNELSYGIGGLLGSFILSKSKRNDSHKEISASLFLCGGMTMLLALLKNHYVFYEIFIMLTAGTIVITQILLITMVQKQCPLKYHGRIFAGLEISTNTGLPLGMIIFGILSERIDMLSVFGLAGIALAALSVYCDRGRKNDGFLGHKIR